MQQAQVSVQQAQVSVQQAQVSVQQAQVNVQQAQVSVQQAQVSVQQEHYKETSAAWMDDAISPQHHQLQAISPSHKARPQLARSVADMVCHWDSNDTGSALGQDGSDWSRDLATLTFEAMELVADAGRRPPTVDKVWSL